LSYYEGLPGSPEHPTKILTSTLRNSPARSVVALLGFFLLCYGVAAFSAFFTASSIPVWYAALNKPSFNPPDWIFPPIWTMLYGLMAIAAWLVWRTPRTGPDAGFRRFGLAFFAVQLLLNALWPPVFFSFHQILPALAIILCLWVAILFTALHFWRVERFAAGLMIPYLLWITFATALNIGIYRLN
jgi:benzodiazapine receptor